MDTDNSILISNHIFKHETIYYIIGYSVSGCKYG